MKTDTGNSAFCMKEREYNMTEQDFRRLSEFIHAECGIKMPPSKKTMLQARLQKRLRALNLKSFSEYCGYVYGPGGMESELAQMIDAVTTNKTDFFREPLHFDYLVRQAVPAWLKDHGSAAAKSLRVWSAGCSTGEEPYTLAMVLSEHAEQRPGFRFSILATDISTRVLEKARLGIYGEEQAAPIPSDLKRKYLLRSRDSRKRLVRIEPALRRTVKFGRLNFMDDDFGFREKLDVIFCRNVIIYFDRPTQEALLKRFCRYLNPGGYVFLGHSETLHGMDVPLVGVSATVYRKQA